MAVLCSISSSPSSSSPYPHLPFPLSLSSSSRSIGNWAQSPPPSASSSSWRRLLKPVAAANACPEQTHHRIDRSLVKISEAVDEGELWATACLRVRSFYDLDPSMFRAQDHRRYLAEREFEALKERVAGKREGFRRVSCINATLPLSHILNTSEDLCDSCKFTENGDERVVVGSLDLNNCHNLPDEIVGKRPEGIGADFARAYISNVCVATELQRNGLAYALIAKSKIVAERWGISDLYVHVAVNNIPAKNLYEKSGFIVESDEPAWQARYLDRPRRILLWAGLPINYEL